MEGLGIDVMLDDRGERPGAMFADWELIGVPHRVVVSDRGLKEGKVELQGRREDAGGACAAGRCSGIPESQARRMIVGAEPAAQSACCAPSAAPTGAGAGAQIEEPLADAVRSALAAAVANAAPPRPAFETMDERLKYLRWLGAMSERLKRYKDEHLTRVEFLETVWYESQRPGSRPRWCSG